jgi:hypothetical protein
MNKNKNIYKENIFNINRYNVLLSHGSNKRQSKRYKNRLSVLIKIIDDMDIKKEVNKNEIQRFN